MLLSLLVLLSETDTAEAGSYNPALKITLQTTAPETPSDLTTDFSVADANDVNFDLIVSFIPRDAGIVPGWEIPIGEPVGELSAATTLGLLNAACNTPVRADFSLRNAALDDAETVSFDDLEAKQGLDPSSDGFGTRDFAEDKDGNGLVDAIDRFPDFIPRAVGEEALSKLIRRSAGVTSVAGMPVLVQFLVFEPGTQFDLIGEELDDVVPADRELGYPTLLLLQAIGDPESDPNPDPITDFCTPFTSRHLSFSTYLDADGDGSNNRDDPCPYAPHAALGNHDQDFDFLHAECDPDDSSDEEGQPGNTDQDEDGIPNIDDNCPLVGNEDQTDNDQDFIGDACDENRSVNDPLRPGEKDGLGQLAVLPKDGTYAFSMFTVGQRDADNDGYQNSLDTCPQVPNAGNPTIPNNGDVDGDGLDSTCDPNDDPTTAGANPDQDDDGYLNRQDNCPLAANGRDQPDESAGNQKDQDLDSIGTACDPNPQTGDGELIQVSLQGDVVVGTGTGPSGPPSEKACPKCYTVGEAPPASTPAPTPDARIRDNGGSNTSLIIAIVATVAVALAIIGGAAFLLRRRIEDAVTHGKSS